MLLLSLAAIGMSLCPSCSTPDPKEISEFSAESEETYVFPCFLGGNGLQQATAYAISPSKDSRIKEMTSHFIYQAKPSTPYAIRGYDASNRFSTEIQCLYRENVLVQTVAYRVETSPPKTPFLIQKIPFETTSYTYEKGNLIQSETYDVYNRPTLKETYSYEDNRLRGSALYTPDDVLMARSLFDYKNDSTQLIKRTYFNPDEIKIYEITYRYE